MRQTLGLDVDSTIWDKGARVREAVLEVTGETLDLESVTTWTHILNAYGEKATTEIFACVLSPEAIRARKPYPVPRRSFAASGRNRT